MIRPVLEIAAWLAAASLVAAALGWGFLNIPESSVLALATSAVLVVALVFLTAAVGNATVLFALGESRRDSLRRGVRRVHWFLLAAAPVVAIIWALLSGDNWIARESGEISAWFIATFNWADTTPLFRAELYLSRWLRWVVLPAAALTAVASMLRNGARALASAAWIRAAWRWQTLAAVTAACVLFIDLPWRLAHWSPERLPPNWIQPTLAGLRLLIAGIATMIGVAVIVVTTAVATREATRH